MKRIFVKMSLFAVAAAFSLEVSAQQSVGIGTTTPNPKTVLELSSTTQGFLMPRLTTAQRLAMTLAGTEKGLIVYDSDLGKVCSWNGTAWDTGSSNNTWNINGNTGNTTANFLGNIDNIPLIFKVGNLKSGRLDATTAESSYGVMALLSSTGGDNSAFGAQAAQNNTTGGLNTAIGAYSLNLNTTGSGNTAVGYQALRTNTASYNVAVGGNAAYSNTVGDFLTAIGVNALRNNLSAAENTALGYEALFSTITGGRNTAVGLYALRQTTGTNNTSIGWSSGDFNTSGTDNTFVGSNADATVNNLTNATAIGANATVSTSNSMVLGNGANVGIGTSSPTDLLHLVGTSGNTLRIEDGNQAVGRVLTSDANGNATWAAPAIGTNIYNSDGSLTGNRIVTQAANTLSFTSTAVNGFSVDGTTFSVDAFNNRVGIGTITPGGNLSVLGNAIVGPANTSRAASGLTISQNNTVAFSNNSDATDVNRMLSIVNEANTANSYAHLGFRVNPGGGANNQLLDMKYVNPNDGTSKLIYTFGPGGAFTDRFTFTSTGNLGIGTTNPFLKLEITGTGTIQSSVNSSNGIANMAVSSAGTGAFDYAGISLSNNVTSPVFRVQSYSTAAAVPNETRLTVMINSPLTFYTNNLERMRLTGTGQLGIGNTNPTEALDVTGNVRFSGALMPDNLAGTAGQVLTSAGAGVAPTWTTVNSLPGGINGQTLRHNGTNWVANSLLYNDGVGVGIGTSTLGSSIFKVSGPEIIYELNTSGVYLTSSNSVGNGYSQQVYDGSTGATGTPTMRYVFSPRNNANTGTTPMGELTFGKISNQNYGYIAFSTRNAGGTYAERVRIDSEGNMGIGTGAPTQALDVTGNVKFSGALMPNNTAGTAGQVLTSAGAGVAPTWTTPTGGLSGGTLNYLPKWTSATTLSSTSLVYDNGTNIGIGTTAAPTLLSISNGFAPIYSTVLNTPAASAGTTLGGIYFADSQNSGVAQAGMYGYRDAVSGGSGDLPSRLSFYTTLDGSGFTSERMRLTSEGRLAVGAVTFANSDAYGGVISARKNEPTVNGFAGAFIDVLNTASNTAGALSGIRFGNFDNSGPSFGSEYYPGAIMWQSDGQTGGRGDMIFITGVVGQANTSNTRMIIKNGGNVGIGTTAPSEALDVAGNIRFSGALMPNNTAGTAGQVLTSAGAGLPPTWTNPSGGVSGSGTATQVAFWDGATSLSSSSNLYWDNTNTRLGIGTTTPTSILHITDMTPEVLLESTAGNFNIGYRYKTALYEWFMGQENAWGGKFSIRDEVNSSTRFTIDEFGYVGISQQSPLTQLHIRGANTLTQTFENADAISNSATTIAQINFTDAQTTDPQATIRVERDQFSNDATDVPTAITFLTVKDGNDPSSLTEAMRISNGGMVGIGTNNPQNSLHIVGGGITIQDGSQAFGRVLTSDANGNGTWQAPAASTNIYNANGSLTSARTVTQNANTLAFTATAINAFSVDGSTFSVDASNNRVGIGTTGPQATLHISNATPRFTISSSVANNANGSQLGEIWFNDAVTSNPQAGIRVFRDGAASGDAPTAMVFYTTSTGGLSNSEKMRLTKEGNLQFSGALMPGASAGTSGQFLQSTGINTPPTWVTGGILAGGTTNYIPKWSSSNSLSTTSLLYDNGTSVGINTTIPSASTKLHVSGGNIGLDNNRSISWNTTGGVMSTVISLDNTDAFSMRGLGGGVKVLDSGGTPLIFIDNTGKVGINKTSPLTYPLDVNNQVGLTAAKFGSVDPLYIITSGIGFNAYFSGGYKNGVTGFSSVIISSVTTGRMDFMTSTASVAADASTSLSTAMSIFPNTRNVHIGDIQDHGVPLLVERAIADISGANGTFLKLSNNSGAVGTMSGIIFKTMNAGTNLYSKGGLFFRSNNASDGRGDMIFAVNNTAGGTNVSASDEIMRISSAGFVGIGTTMPTYKLDIQSTGGTTVNIQSNVNTDVWTYYGQNGAFAGAMGMRVGGVMTFFNGGDRMVILNSGNVGIGTTTPQAKFQISGGDMNTDWSFTMNHYEAGWGANATRPFLNKQWDGANLDYLYLGSTGNNSNTSQAAILLGGGSGVLFGRGTDAGNGLSVEHMRINTAGRVGIGTTNPSTQVKLHLGAGDIGFDDNSAYGIKWVNGANMIAHIHRWVSDSRLYVTNAGNSNLTGVYLAANATTWTSTSDARLKENIVETNYGLKDVLKLSVKEYNFKTVNDKKKEIGFLAQEVYKIIPEFVEKGDDSEFPGAYDTKSLEKSDFKSWGINYDGFGILSIKAIQELNTKLEDELKKKDDQIKTLETQYQDLLKRVTELEKK